MSKASSVVASFTQQSIGKEFHSLGPRTENARRPHESVQMVRRHNELMTSAGAYDVSVPSRRSEHSRQLDTVARYR